MRISGKARAEACSAHGEHNEIESSGSNRKSRNINFIIMTNASGAHLWKFGRRVSPLLYSHGIKRVHACMQAFIAIALHNVNSASCPAK